MDEQFIKKPWYKTAWGIVGLSVLSLLFVLLLLFAGFFVFYAVQLKFGDAEKLVKQFTPEQTEVKNQKLDFGKQTAGMQKFIRAHNPTIGASNAKITIVEFIDFECQYCRQAYPVFKAVMQKYEPVARVVFKHMPFKGSHPDAELAANATACANEQGKFWQYYDLLFSDIKLDSDTLLAYAGQIGLDEEQFALCLSETKFQANINQDIMDAASLGIQGTPTYFVNGYKISGTLTAELWDKVILGLLN